MYTFFFRFSFSTAVHHNSYYFRLKKIIIINHTFLYIFYCEKLIEIDIKCQR